MRIKNLLTSVGTILFILIAMASCQEDVSNIGSEILGAEPPNGVLDDSYSILSYSRKQAPVQSNRLPAYQLGVYNDPVYGKSAVSLLSQLTINVNDPKFGDEATVDSVFVYLPYFSRDISVDSIKTYQIDSIYGNSPINITISESKYYLREYDPDSGFQEFQSYYSNQGPEFENFLGEELARVEDFKPIPGGYILREGEEDQEYIAPGLRVALPKEFFQTKIIDKEGSAELRNNNNFRDYLRGLYFKVDSPGNDGSLFIFDATKAYVEIFYNSLKSGDEEERENKTFKLGFGGINVNTFENAPLPQNILSEVENPDTINGNDNLYLRGGDGIISVIELFGKDSDNNGVADELELLRAKKWLINEANLIFYVNQDIVTGGDSEPERIMIYDLKNSNVLMDYQADPSNGLPPLNAVTNHLGRLERGSDENGKFYKLKLTNHISNLINKDSTNVPLGLVVSQNVLNRTTQEFLSPQDPEIEKIPSSAVVSPQGTVLYGNNSSNEEKKLKLQIYYTEPN